jgi:hypothetical protein
VLFIINTPSTMPTVPLPLPFPPSSPSFTFIRHAQAPCSYIDAFHLPSRLGYRDLGETEMDGDVDVDIEGEAVGEKGMHARAYSSEGSGARHARSLSARGRVGHWGESSSYPCISCTGYKSRAKIASQKIVWVRGVEPRSAS